MRRFAGNVFGSFWLLGFGVLVRRQNVGSVNKHIVSNEMRCFMEFSTKELQQKSTNNSFVKKCSTIFL